MLNTEIGKTGEVIVEGHVIGRLDGFTFAPDAAEAGSDAKALQATALKALAGEIDARAEKLAKAPDEQFVLTSDGTIRWTGDAVAKLVAADEPLHPRLRIISDDRLAGASREQVQTRLDLWLKTHIEKLLGPLFDLAKAEDITGIARGIAFQLIEALGVLERSRIATEMKDLDQPSRASLRKYGVRFGAYHIYTPALLKPAARALASLLWAEKQHNVDMSALSNAQHLAGSGRTSFPVDKALDRDAYRMLGYRQCGERAVRVDILERLADLIRPALSWREGSLGDKPAGAFDGRGFVVTQAMTSLTGSAGEDFASVLRALGYRMEKRPALPKPVVEAAVVEAAVTDAVAEAPADTAEEIAPVEEVTVATSEAVAAAPQVTEQVLEEVAATPLPEVSPVAAQEPAAVEATSVEAEPAPAVTVETPAAEASPETAVEATSETAGVTETVAADAATIAPETPAEPEMVEVWRPGGRSEERRPRHGHDRNRHRTPNTQSAPQDGTQPVAAAGDATEADGAKRERHGRGRRDRSNEFRKLRADAPAGTATPAADGAPVVREPRDDKNQGPGQGQGRPPRERFEGKSGDRNRDNNKGKFGGGRDKGGRDRDNKGGGRDKGGPSHRQFATTAAPRERDRPIDPNSPFAKLAALREQLTAGRKD